MKNLGYIINEKDIATKGYVDDEIKTIELKPGPIGPMGPKPIKGVDYFTESDKQEIAQAAAAINPSVKTKTQTLANTATLHKITVEGKITNVILADAVTHKEIVADIAYPNIMSTNNTIEVDFRTDTPENNVDVLISYI